MLINESVRRKRLERTVSGFDSMFSVKELLTAYSMVQKSIINYIL